MRAGTPFIQTECVLPPSPSFWPSVLKLPSQLWWHVSTHNYRGQRNLDNSLKLRRQPWQKARVQNTAHIFIPSCYSQFGWCSLLLWGCRSLRRDHISSLSQQRFSLPWLDVCSIWCFTCVIREMLHAKKKRQVFYYLHCIWFCFFICF